MMYVILSPSCLVSIVAVSALPSMYQVIWSLGSAWEAFCNGLTASFMCPLLLSTMPRFFQQVAAEVGSSAVTLSQAALALSNLAWASFGSAVDAPTFAKLVASPT